MYATMTGQSMYGEKNDNYNRKIINDQQKQIYFIGTSCASTYQCDTKKQINISEKVI